MIELRTDNPKMEARYYQLHALLYERQLRDISNKLDDIFWWVDGNESVASLAIGDVLRDVEHTLSNKSIIKQVCKEFNYAQEDNIDASSHL